MATNASEEYHDLGCDPCKGNGKSRPAVKYCQVCDEMLCTDCVRSHLRNKVLKRHPLNDNLSASFKRTEIHPVALCDKHKTEKVEHFCETHNVLCCDKCRFVIHNSCNIVAIKTKSQSENQSQLIKNSLQLIQTLQQHVKQIKANQEQNKKSLKTNTVQCFTEVSAIKKELDDLFIKLEKEVIAEIVQKEANIKSQIDEHIAKSEHLLQQLNDCKGMLEDCESTSDDELMFIGLDKSKDDIDKIAKLIDELQDIIITPDLQFEAQDDVKNMRKNIKKLGNVKLGQSMRQTAQATGATPRVSHVNATSQTKIDDTSATSTRKNQATVERHTSNILGVTFSSKKALDVNSNWISGSTFLETGELVLCDLTNSKLLLFSPDLTLKGELILPGKPFDVAAITERRVAVTTPDGDQLIFVDTTPTMSVTNKTKLKSDMHGIVSRSQLYVLVHGGRGGGQHEILVVSHDGRQVRKINLSAVGIKWPYYIAVNRDESRVFVSDSGYYDGTNSVYCLDCQSGTKLFRYRSEELNWPQGLFVDDNNVLMICWWGSHKITVVTAEGRHKRTLLSDTDGLYRPLTVSYRPRDGTLIVGMYDTSPACLVFRLKSK